MALGGKNLFWEAPETFTGEIARRYAAVMRLTVLNVVGHSERRGRFRKMTLPKELQSVFGDNGATVNPQSSKLPPTPTQAHRLLRRLLSEREQGMTDAVVANQVRAMLDGCSPSNWPLHHRLRAGVGYRHRQGPAESRRENQPRVRRRSARRWQKSPKSRQPPRCGLLWRRRQSRQHRRSYGAGPT